MPLVPSFGPIMKEHVNVIGVGLVKLEMHIVQIALRGYQHGDLLRLVSRFPLRTSMGVTR